MSMDAEGSGLDGRDAQALSGAWYPDEPAWDADLQASEARWAQGPQAVQAWLDEDSGAAADDQEAQEEARAELNGDDATLAGRYLDAVEDHWEEVRITEGQAQDDYDEWRHEQELEAAKFDALMDAWEAKQEGPSHADDYTSWPDEEAAAEAAEGPVAEL